MERAQFQGVPHGTQSEIETSTESLRVVSPVVWPEWRGPVFAARTCPFFLARRSPQSLLALSTPPYRVLPRHKYKTLPANDALAQYRPLLHPRRAPAGSLSVLAASLKVWQFTLAAVIWPLCLLVPALLAGSPTLPMLLVTEAAAIPC